MTKGGITRRITSLLSLLLSSKHGVMVRVGNTNCKRGRGIAWFLRALSSDGVQSPSLSVPTEFTGALRVVKLAKKLTDEVQIIGDCKILTKDMNEGTSVRPSA